MVEPSSGALGAAAHPSLQRDYLALTERFKALWTFQQFLKGIQQTFLGESPDLAIDFNGIYERLRGIPDRLASGEPAARIAEIADRLETELALAARDLTLRDRAVSPSLVRRFFEKVRPQGEQILGNLLRFYFSQPILDGDLADKIDFLATQAAALPGGDGHTARPLAEIVAFFEKALGDCPWATRGEADAEGTIASLDLLSERIDAARDFDELVSDRLLEDLRQLKSSIGTTRSNPRVLAAMSVCNVKTRSIFQRLFAAEKGRIQDAVERIDELERELAQGSARPVPGDFDRLRSTRRDFDLREAESRLRARDVVALKSTVRELLEKFNLNDLDPEEIEEAVELEAEETHMDAVSAENRIVQGGFHKILAAVEIGDGSFQEVARLGLDPREIRIARELLSSGQRPGSETDASVLEAAALRLACEEGSARLRQARKMGRGSEGLLPDLRESLLLAAEIDRRLAATLSDTGTNLTGEERPSVLRARYRLLRAYADLWVLLDDAGA
jgi:hypothetical protein